MPEPDTADLHAAISAGVAAALEHLFDSPDIANAIRLGVRDAVWHLGIAANATGNADSEQWGTCHGAEEQSDRRQATAEVGRGS